MCIVCALCVLLFHCRFVTVFVSNSSGWLADGLANSGTLSMTQTRKLLQVVGSVGPGEKEGGGVAGGGTVAPHSARTLHLLWDCCSCPCRMYPERGCLGGYGDRGIGGGGAAVLRWVSAGVRDRGDG